MLRYAISRFNAPQPESAGRGRLSDGPNMIVLLCGVAVAIALLAGLGARQFTRHLDTGRSLPKAELSGAASELGYKGERDFRIDNERASLALSDVLGAQPGAQRLWENAESGNRGIVWASGETSGTDGATCRSLARRTLINGIFRNTASTACRTASGEWEQKGGWRAE